MYRNRVFFFGSVHYQTPVYIVLPSAPVHAFLKFLLPIILTTFLRSHWLLYTTNIVKEITRSSGDRVEISYNKTLRVASLELTLTQCLLRETTAFLLYSCLV